MPSIGGWFNANRVIALARQEVEADQIARRVGERHNFGRPTAPGLALWPDFVSLFCARPMAMDLDNAGNRPERILCRDHPIPH